jgi:hypothetical protein
MAKKFLLEKKQSFNYMKQLWQKGNLYTITLKIMKSALTTVVPAIKINFSRIFLFSHFSTMIKSGNFDMVFVEIIFFAIFYKDNPI